MDNGGKVDPEIDERYYPSESNAQVFQYSNDPLAFEIRADFEKAEDLIKKLGIPLYYNWKYISAYFGGAKSPRIFAHLPQRFNNFTIEIFGNKVVLPPLIKKKRDLNPDKAEIPKYGCDPIYWRESNQYGIHIWRTRVFNHPLSTLRPTAAKPLSLPQPWGLYLEECWHPNAGMRWTLNWSENSNLQISKVTDFMNDALLMLGYPRNKIRKWRNRRLSDRKEFLDTLLDIYQMESNRLETRPSVAVIAAAMGFSNSTLRRRLNEHGIKWPPE